MKKAKATARWFILDILWNKIKPDWDLPQSYVPWCGASSFYGRALLYLAISYT